MTTQNIHGGLTLEQVEEPKGQQAGLWLVKRGETILGMLSKFKDTRSYYHPWKAYAGHGMTAEFLGSFYQPRAGWAPSDDMNMSGKNGAIDAIVKAAA